MAILQEPKRQPRHSPQTATNVQHVLRLAAQLLEHVLKPLHARLVALRLLRCEDSVERSTQLGDIVVDLVVGRVGQPHKLVLFGKAAETFRDVWMGPPSWDGGVERFGCVVDVEQSFEIW